MIYYSVKEYDCVGKLLEVNGGEAVLDLIHTVGEDPIYCDINKCRLATKEEIELVFENDNNF